MKVIAGKRKMFPDGLEHEGAELSGVFLRSGLNWGLRGSLPGETCSRGVGTQGLQSPLWRDARTAGPGRTWFGQLRPPVGPLLKCTKVSIQLTKLAGDCKPTGVHN